ncbi:enoyl-CoA hydratase/isomerase family protein [Methylocystis sp. WRRC1]|uniref:enoyl-CoA hydratase-related protein n=1 Tax=Methylocystis sp. WRRC1 TaxID=1732014 RepID=UPI001D134C3D|nr:enoyl-CoA hydratase-related protein [Methylocystis sp. WRRC1]MCC3244816.1 enoyl-CoA hydratase/isomerase family protein [Methylocystis sp. WRRC1]
MSDLLETTDARGVTTLTLNRPGRRNALDDMLVVHLTEALRRLEAAPDVRIVVLMGAGESFCSGGDIEWMKRLANGAPEHNEADALALAELMKTLDQLSKPTIAVAHGAVYGGGVGLVACCDVGIASDGASFCLSEVRLGLIPAVVGPYMTRSIGIRQARRYFLTAEVISAKRAAEIGLIHDFAQEVELPKLLDRIIKAMLLGAPCAQADAKALMRLCEGRSIDEQLARETAQRLAARRVSSEGREGLSAFLEKRAPWWCAGPGGANVS